MGCDRKIGPFPCCSVVQGDCLELMKQLPDGCVDAVITDPPYGNGHYATDVDGHTQVLAEFIRTIPAAIFGYPEKLVKWCMDSRLFPVEWLTWWPTNAACKSSNGPGLRRESEHVAIFGECNRVRGREYSSETLKMAGHMPHRQRGGFSVSSDGAYWGDVWTDASPGLLANRHLRQHPNEKPVAIMLRLVNMFLSETILDPFCGSGTTLVAAKKLGRHFLGFEISPEYCEIARKRIAAVEAQPTLFEPKPEQGELGL